MFIHKRNSMIHHDLVPQAPQNYLQKNLVNTCQKMIYSCNFFILCADQQLQPYFLWHFKSILHCALALFLVCMIIEGKMFSREAPIIKKVLTTLKVALDNDNLPIYLFLNFKQIFFLFCNYVTVLSRRGPIEGPRSIANVP